jgi:NADPH:quinone reductase-like Zn-dependent oxidoreductase
MNAMIIQQYGGPEQLVIQELPVPQPADGEVLIRVKALGINHAEIYMRKGAWGQVARVSGIECVGEVVTDTTGHLAERAYVAAILGGMGRTRNGSYAEYTTVPATNVVPLRASLSWAELAAIPESYVTAWCCLFDRHALKRDNVVLIRGGTSALGQAAINLAVQAGATVLATTRSEAKKPRLKALGVSEVLIEIGNLVAEIRRLHPNGIDCVLDLIGNSTLHDSLKTCKKGGRVVMAGFLGGSDPVPVDVISSLPTGVDLTFFGSAFVLGNKDYPLSGIPLQRMVEDVERGIYPAKPVKVFNFEQIPDAHRLMESNQANGKIVVVV